MASKRLGSLVFPLILSLGPASCAGNSPPRSSASVASPAADAAARLAKKKRVTFAQRPAVLTQACDSAQQASSSPQSGFASSPAVRVIRQWMPAQLDVEV